MKASPWAEKVRMRIGHFDAQTHIFYLSKRLVLVLKIWTLTRPNDATSHPVSSELSALALAVASHFVQLHFF